MKLFFLGKSSKEVSSPSLRRRASYIEMMKKFFLGKSPNEDKSSKKIHSKKSVLDLCCARARTPNIQPQENFSQACDAENSYFQKDDDSLESLSHSKVLDQYIDREKEQESHLTEDHFENGYSGRQHLPPRFHHTASASPPRKPKQLSLSFRETKAASTLYFGHESTRKIAKKVVERLSQSQAPAKVSSEYADADGPITIEEMVTPFQPIPNRRESCFWTLQEIQEESLIKEWGKSSSLSPKSRKAAERSSTMTSARQVVTSIASKKNLKKDGGLSSFVQPKKLFKDGIKCAATTNEKPQRPGRVVASRYNQSTNQLSVARKRSLPENDKDESKRNYKKRCLSIGKSQSESKNLGTESRVKKKWEIPSEITESEKSPLSIAVKPDFLPRIRTARCANETPRDSGPAKRVAKLRKFKEAEQRAVLLSEELEERNFLRGRDLSVPVLIQTIRSLTEEKVQMAFEVSSILRDQVAERAATKEEVRLLKAELDSQRRRLEAENNELKSTLGNELERRSTESSVINEKSCPVNSDFHQQNAQKPDELKQLELKEETLLTTVLQEKLCSKERDIEQLHAELAAAVRGNDILKCEAQNALDTLSSANHKMKDFELQMMKKEEHMNQLQNELQECMKELSLVKGILPKVSQQRDELWEDVKQYSEKNMLLNSENSLLKQKVEVLEEDLKYKSHFSSLTSFDKYIGSID